MTEAFYALSGPWPGETPETRVEAVEGLDPAKAFVFYPKRAGSVASQAGRRRGVWDRLSQFVRVNSFTVLRLVGLRSRAGLLHSS